MAFGDLVQTNEQKGVDSTLTRSFASTAVTGNLLIGWVHFDGGLSLTTPPAGYTEIQTEEGASFGSWLGYKISDGSEASISGTISASEALTVGFAEYEFDIAAPSVLSNENVASINSDVSSIATGAVTPTNAKNLVLGIAAIESGARWDPGDTVSAGFTQDVSASANNRPGTVLGRAVNAALSAQEMTATSGDLSDRAYAAIVAFNDATPAANPGLRFDVTGGGTRTLNRVTVLTPAGVLLAQFTNVAMTSDAVEIDSDSIGAVDDIVQVIGIDDGASNDLDFGFAGEVVVVDLDGSDESA